MFRNTHASVGQNPGHSVEATWTSLSETRSCDSAPRRDAAPWDRRTPARAPRPLPPPRGISLTEVLIAMGILTVGLLGVASVFPVGSYYMQKGDVSDRGSAIAQAAFNEAISRGVLNPENWLVWHDITINGVTNQLGTGSTFTRPFAEMLRRQKAVQAAGGWTNVDSQKYTALEFGSVFVIDPLGISSIALINPTTGLHVSDANITRMRPGSVFPASKVWNSGIPSNLPATSVWYSWSDIGSNVGPRWPVRRVTLRQPVSGSSPYEPLNISIANKLFSSHDDLTIDLPAGQNKPSSTPFELANLDNGPIANDALTRQSRGDYSWIVTVSPTSADARDALATDPSAHSYEVSVVVFYKRPLAVLSPTDSTEILDNVADLQKDERGFNARIVSTGLNGGEVLLSSTSTDQPFDTLKIGQWIMLCGPHPNNTNERPIVTARWYRVLALEGKDTKLDANGNETSDPSQPERRLVSLRGPQWPWEPAASLTYNDQLSNSLYVCIPAGAVAVHAKTLKLGGNSIWSGGAGGFGTTPPLGTVQPGNGKVGH